MSVERIYERDVDITLIEEFSVSPDFARWALNQTKQFTDLEADVVETHLSLFNKDGESDLVIVYNIRNANERIALLIEDKVDAVFQANQAQRYRIRGDDGISKGDWSRYEVILCAPRAFLDRSDRVGDFDSELAYETIAAYLRSRANDKRSQYRAEFFEAAAPRGGKAYIRVKDEETDKFWNSAFALAERDFPELEMRRPDYASQTSWVSFRPSDFPSRVIVDLKSKHGFSDLTFSGVSFSELESVIKSITSKSWLFGRPERLR